MNHPIRSSLRPATPTHPAADHPRIARWLPCALLAAAGWWGLSDPLLPPARGEVTEEVRQTYPLAADGVLRLDDLNGSVQIDGTDAAEVRLVATKRGRDPEDLRTVEIQVDARPAALTIHTEYRRSPDGHSTHASVGYVLSVPRTVRIERLALTNGNAAVQGVVGPIDARCTNGGLSVHGAAGPLRLDSTNGTIDASVRPAVLPGQVKISGTNGSIRLRVEGGSAAAPAGPAAGRSGGPDAGVEITTTNGSVSLTLPAAVSVHLSARTATGSIGVPGFDPAAAPVRRALVGAQLEADLNGGGTPVRVQTTNGSITISKLTAG